MKLLWRVQLQNQCPRLFYYQNNWGCYLREDPQNVWVPFLKHLAEDQKHLDFSVSCAEGGRKIQCAVFAFTGLLFASDSWISNQVPDSPGN